MTRILTARIARAAQPLNLYVVKHQPRDDPDVFPAANDALTRMKQAWQEYWAYGLLWPKMPSSFTLAQKQAAWRGITAGGRAYTNGKGTDTCADFISGRNLDKEEPAWDKARLTGGGLANVLDPNPVDMGKWGKCLKVQTLDGDGPPPDPALVNWELTPWLVQLAVIARTDGQVIPFPQLDGNDVPVPVVSPGGFNYWPASLLTKLPEGDRFPCPYVPARW